MRVPWFAVAAASLLVSGCFGGEAETPRLARPTDVGAGPPVPATPSRELPQYNVSDPGIRHTMRWHVGDGWDWESNGTPRMYRTVRVLEEHQAGNRTLYKVEETSGRVGNRANSRLTQWVDGTSWTILNSTDITGSTFHFVPAKPMRFYRNGTFGFNETGYDGLADRVVDRGWYVASFLEPRWEVVRLSWGQVAAFVVVHESITSEGGHSLVKQWVSPDHANPVRYEVDDVRWSLVALSEGGRQLGVLQPT